MPTILPIGIGALPNDNLGDQIRTAFDKCNQNFNNLNLAIPTGTSTLQVFAKASQTMIKGQAVYISSTLNSNIIISLSTNTYNFQVLSSKTLGLLVQNLSANSQGFVITRGILTNLNTSTALNGDPVWLGTNGQLIYGILNKPLPPLRIVFIGYVVRSHGVNGEIYVDVENGFNFTDLNDIKITLPTMGQTLFYNSILNVWQNVDPTYLIGGSYVRYIARNLLTNTTGGTTALILLAQSVILANTLISSDLLHIELYMQKLNGNGSANISLWLNTSPSLSGATQIAIALMSNTTNAQTLTRGYFLNNGSLNGYLFNNFSVDGMEAIGGGIYSSVPYNVGTTYYILACMQLNSSLDVAQFKALKITT